MASMLEIGRQILRGEREVNWYRAEGGDEGWLCPALFWFFPEPLANIYVRAESKRGTT
jgi:hypothetical protein